MVHMCSWEGVRVIFPMPLQKDPPLDLSNPNPFIGEGDSQSKVGSVAYRYVAVACTLKGFACIQGQV